MPVPRIIEFKKEKKERAALDSSEKEYCLIGRKQKYNPLLKFKTYFLSHDFLKNNDWTKNDFNEIPDFDNSDLNLNETVLKVIKAYETILSEKEKYPSLYKNINTQKVKDIIKDYKEIMFPFKSPGPLTKELQIACAKDSSTLQPSYTRADGDKIFRMLTVKEILLARVDDFNREYNASDVKRSLDERITLFEHHLATCTGIAYKAGTGKIKIIPQCSQLIEIHPKHEKDHIQVDYNLVDGEELDWFADDYNVKDLLSTVVEGDASLLKEYQKIVEPLLVMKGKNRDAWKKYDGLFVSNEDRIYPISALSLGCSAGVGTNCSKEEQFTIQVTSRNQK